MLPDVRENSVAHENSVMVDFAIAVLRPYSSCFNQNFFNQFFKTFPPVVIADKMYLARNLVSIHTIA